MQLKNVARAARAQSFLHYIGGRFLTQEEYFALGRQLLNSSSRFDPIQFWEPNVEHYQVRLQFFGFPNRFYAV